jgi:hypothetical protein
MDTFTVEAPPEFWDTIVWAMRAVVIVMAAWFTLDALAFVYEIRDRAKENRNQ